MYLDILHKLKVSLNWKPEENKDKIQFIFLRSKLPWLMCWKLQSGPRQANQNADQERKSTEIGVSPIELLNSAPVETNQKEIFIKT